MSAQCRYIAAWGFDSPKRPQHSHENMRSENSSSTTTIVIVVLLIVVVLGIAALAACAGLGWFMVEAVPKMNPPPPAPPMPIRAVPVPTAPVPPPQEAPEPADDAFGEPNRDAERQPAK